MASPDACSALPGQRSFRKFWTYQPNACAPSVGVCGDLCASPGFQLNSIPNSGGAYTIDVAGRAKSIAMFILMTRAASDNDTDCGGSPKRRGGYWADSFRSDRKKSGSQIYFVPYNKPTAEIVALIGAYAHADLQKMVTMGEADSVSVTARYAGAGTIAISAKIFIDGKTIDVPFAASNTTGERWVISS